LTTAASNGVAFILQSSPDGGTTWHTIAGATKAQLARKTASIDTTSKDDNSDESALPGKRSWTITFDQLWVSGDAGQLDLQAAQAAGTIIKAKIQYNGSGNTYTGSCFVTDLNEDFPDNGAVTFTGTLQGVGALAAAGTAH
jgi:predicted secreted protein